jgi:hypothetical protein
MLKISSSTLRTAAGIQEEIEKLEGELEQLLTASGVSKAGDGSLGSPSQRGTTKVVARSATKKAGKSGPGALAAGVRQILRRQGKPIRVAEIYRRLLAAGYSFRSSNPKNSLTAQMYRMRGVRRTGPGEFAAE